MRPFHFGASIPSTGTSRAAARSAAARLARGLIVALCLLTGFSAPTELAA